MFTHECSVCPAHVNVNRTICACRALSTMVAYMAKRFEALRESGAISSYTLDEAIGITLNNVMFLRRCTRRELGEAIGVTSRLLVGSSGGR